MKLSHVRWRFVIVATERVADTVLLTWIELNATILTMHFHFLLPPINQSYLINLNYLEIIPRVFRRGNQHSVLTNL